MKKGQFWVRAMAGDSWVSANMLDLDQDSFNALVLDRLGDHIVKIKEESILEEEPIILRVKPELVDKYLNKK